MTNSLGTPSPSAREDIRHVSLNYFERLALGKLCQEKINDSIRKGLLGSEKDWSDLKKKIVG